MNKWIFIFFFFSGDIISSSRQLTALIPLSLSHYKSLSAIFLSKFLRWHLVSLQCWWMQVFAGQLTLVCPCLRVHWRILLMSLSLFLQQCPTYLAHLSWMVCEMKGKWLYKWYFGRCLLPGFVQNSM